MHCSGPGLTEADHLWAAGGGGYCILDLDSLKQTIFGLQEEVGTVFCTWTH